ncbi:hypothetical protein FRB91_005258 [Serendipita sp. 411]|nr:hypothetical protein FRC18_000602 [Serendipita sp. 400]KAG8841195.1 hypothetical protein FRB91_005258 [Serendipita sp. 411]
MPLPRGGMSEILVACAIGVGSAFYILQPYIQQQPRQEKWTPEKQTPSTPFGQPDQPTHTSSNGKTT